MSALTEEERAFLRSGVRALARIATVDAKGRPHVVPGGWSWDEAADEIVLGGREVLRTARVRHVRDTGRVAISIDGVNTEGGWAPWALLARGPATVDEAAEVIRLIPDWTKSWGLSGAKSF